MSTVNKLPISNIYQSKLRTSINRDIFLKPCFFISRQGSDYQVICKEKKILGVCIVWFQLLGIGFMQEYDTLVQHIITGANRHYVGKRFIPLFIQFGITDEVIEYSVVDFKQSSDSILTSFKKHFDSVQKKLMIQGLLPSSKHNLPDSTITIDLTLNHDQLRSEIGKNTKEKIKKAIKGVETHGFSHHQEQTQKQYDNFYELYLQTADSKGFGAVTPEMRDRLSHDARTQGYGRLYSINDGDSGMISGAFCITIEDTLIYLYGANDRTWGNLGISQLLHRTIIQSAQQDGLKSYDFLGTSRIGSSSDRLTHVTQFKLGFGGSKHEYIGSRDKPIKPWLYWIYQKLFW